MTVLPTKDGSFGGRETVALFTRFWQIHRYIELMIVKHLKLINNGRKKFNTNTNNGHTD